MMQEHFEKMFHQGLDLLNAGSSAAAIKVFVKLLDNLPCHESFTNFRVAAFAHKGLAHIQLNDYKSAAEAFSLIPPYVSLREGVIPEVFFVLFLFIK